MKKKTIEVESDFSDDSSHDALYNQNKDNINSTDSEANEKQHIQQKKKRKYCKGLEKKSQLCVNQMESQDRLKESVLLEKLKKSIKLLKD